MSAVNRVIQEIRAEAKSLRSQQMPTMAGLIDKYADRMEIAIREEHEDIKAVIYSMPRMNFAGKTLIDSWYYRLREAIGETEAPHA